MSIQVSTNRQSGFLAAGFIFAKKLKKCGKGFYHEPISMTKVVGILICLAGLFLINK